VDINLSIDPPPTTETPTRIQVSCGLTTVSVHEHDSVQDSGSWAVWTRGGSTIGEYHPTVEQALAEARDYVQHQELSRLLHTQLRDKLDPAQ
jgi:hypothetical protein